MWPEFKDWWEQNNLECPFPLDLMLTHLSSVSNPFEKELGGTETINEGPFSELGYRILWGTECQMEMNEKTRRKEKQRGHTYLFHSPRPCSFSQLHDKFRDLLIFFFFSALACWPALLTGLCGSSWPDSHKCATTLVLEVWKNILLQWALISSNWTQERSINTPSSAWIPMNSGTPDSSQKHWQLLALINVHFVCVYISVCINVGVRVVASLVLVTNINRHLVLKIIPLWSRICFKLI